MKKFILFFLFLFIEFSIKSLTFFHRYDEKIIIIATYEQEIPDPFVLCSCGMLTEYKCEFLEKGKKVMFKYEIYPYCNCCPYTLKKIEIKGDIFDVEKLGHNSEFEIFMPSENKIMLERQFSCCGDCSEACVIL